MPWRIEEAVSTEPDIDEALHGDTDSIRAALVDTLLSARAHSQNHNRRASFLGSRGATWVVIDAEDELADAWADLASGVQQLLQEHKKLLGKSRLESTAEEHARDEIQQRALLSGDLRVLEHMCATEDQAQELAEALGRLPVKKR